MIALDIEGTLTSKTLPDHLPKGLGRWLLQRYSPEERYWVQRPLAKELIEVLVEQKNRVLLWTVANMPTAREILKTREQLNRLYAERTGQPIEKIATDMERDRFMTAEEAREYGLIDQVLDKRG